MPIELAVSELGGVSAYHLNRLPFTLYAEEWLKVFESGSMIRDFIRRNHPRLSCRCDEYTKASVRLTAAAVARDSGEMYCRRGSLGGVSLYRVRRRWPITLYCDQWLRLLAIEPELRAFISANWDRLSHRGAAVPQRAPSRRLQPWEAVGSDNIIRPVRHQQPPRPQASSSPLLGAGLHQVV